MIARRKETGWRPLSGRSTLALALASGLGALSSCSGAAPARLVTVQQLEEAPLANLVTRQVVLRDPDALAACSSPLGERLGLIQVRNDDQWRILIRQAGIDAPPPNFDRGMVVGVASYAGSPLHDGFPIELHSVRSADGAGYVVAAFTGGNYRPDGTTCASIAYVETLQAVLMVDVNGVRFYPEQ